MHVYIVGVEVKFKNQLYPMIIAPTHIEELCNISIVESGIWFGASTTLTKLEHVLQEQIQTLPEYQTRIYREIVEMLKWFAGHQIRNVSVSITDTSTGPAARPAAERINSNNIHVTSAFHIVS